MSELQNNRKRFKSDTYPLTKPKCKEWSPETGIVLSKGEGFFVSNDLSLISHKMHGALYQQTLEAIVDEVLTNKHRSLVTPNYIWEYIEKFSKRSPPHSTLPSYADALKRLRITLKVNEKIEPLTIEEASHKIPSLMSPGLPFIKTHEAYSTKKIIAKYFKKFKMEWEHVAAGKAVIFPDCAAYARGKICDQTDNELRPTWAMPISIILQETRYAMPLIQAFKEQRCCTNAAYGCEILQGGMMWLNNEILLCKQRYKFTKIFLPIYDNFDPSIPAWLIRDVFSIVMEKFVLTPDDKVKFDECINYFINTPIRNGDGRRYLKTHGIPSGSMFTDIIGTLANMVITWCSSQEVFKSYPLLDFFFSDNSIMCYHNNNKIDVFNYDQFLRFIFGITLNTEESQWTYDQRKIYFLGYVNINGMAYKSTHDLIAKMLFLRQFEDGKSTWENFLSKSLDCLIASAGCSSDIFEACQAVLWQAISDNADIDKSIQMCRNKPRSLRHSITIGFHHFNIRKEFLSNYNLSVPTPTCSKFKLGVHIINEPQNKIKLI